MMRFAIAVGLVGLGMVSCGGSKSAGGSYSSIQDSVAHPTGKLASSNASSVATEFEKIDSSAASGRRIKDGTSGSQTITCPAGGSYSVVASGGQTSGKATVDYNQCCYVESCCIDGSGDWYYSSDANASYSMCGSYSLSVSCESESGTVNYQGCLSGSSGEWIYVITVEGKTYAVSGYYSDGSGSLEISDSTGTYTCTYDENAGSCTGPGGSFNF